MDKNNPIIKTLLDQDEEFRLLWAEHAALEKKLAEFDGIRYLSAQQDLERKSLQKVKLKGRDRMEEIMLQFREGVRAS